MARREHWVERVVKMAEEQRERIKASMRGVVGRPVLRRPNTKTLLQAAIEDPASVDPTGRAQLERWAFDTYGEAARNIIPYLGSDIGTEGEGEL